MMMMPGMDYRQGPTNRRIKSCAAFLVLGAVSLIIMAILLVVYAARIGQLQSVEIFVEDAVEDIDDDAEDLFRNIGGLFAGITAVAILLAFVVGACATDGCHNSFLARVCVLIFFLVTLTMALNFYIIGGMLIYPYENGDTYIEEGCEAVIKGKNDDSYYTGLDPQTRELFEGVEKLDR
jgi:hypothetical protein